MNRRKFLSSIGTALAGFAILPSATTYLRNWRPQSKGIMVPPEGLISAAKIPEGWLSTEMILKYNLEHLQNRMFPVLGAAEDAIGSIITWNNISLTRYKMCQNSDTFTPP
jgi:hypothetical protein